MKQLTKKEILLKLAEEQNKSTCISKHVAALFISEKNEVVLGHNVSIDPKKECVKINKNLNVDLKSNRLIHHNWSRLNEVCAEQTVLMTCCNRRISTKNAVLYITHSPCINCAKLILLSGIYKVYYIDEYDFEKDGLKLLRRFKLISKI
jgi:dCMP deaminase